MGMALGLWSTAWFTTTSSSTGCLGGPCHRLGMELLLHPALLWSQEGVEGWDPSPSPHCEGGQSSLAPATNPDSFQTELTIDAQLHISPRPAKEAKASFSVQLVSSSGPTSCGRGYGSKHNCLLLLLAIPACPV